MSVLNAVRAVNPMNAVNVLNAVNAVNETTPVRRAQSVPAQRDHAQSDCVRKMREGR
jgi:hypothetical protein